MTLVGCSSPTPTLQYYLLHTPTDRVTISDTSKAAKLHLAQLTVSDYLLQRGLALQTQTNTLHISTQHLWAEPFKAGFEKQLTFALMPDIQLSRNLHSDDTIRSIDIDILHLVATHTGEVVISAKYTLSNSPSNGQTSLVDKYFSATLSLEKDGYSNAVTVYRQAISLLADDIKATLAKA